MTCIRPKKTGKRWGILAQNCTAFHGEVALGNVTAYHIALMIKPNGNIFVAIEGRGAYTFGSLVHPGYVKEKLGLKFDGDAANIADLINHQFGEPSDFGKYQENLCE